MRIAPCLLVSLFLLSCANKGKVPSGIIAKDEMSRILWDMVQADQYSDVYLVKDSSHINVRRETLKLYQEVFQLHKVSLDEFRKSFQFYLDHPDLTRGLFDSVLNHGNTERSDIYKNPNPVPPHSKILPTPPVFKPINKPVNGKPATPAPAVPVPSLRPGMPPHVFPRAGAKTPLKTKLIPQ